ncbi:MAG: DUF4350 domain-containing protein, partial [Bifidobacteriaceae bacterium]|nr:DUF4350 domain-containing protein [Bifidobacteriaceae bacterium]
APPASRFAGQAGGEDAMTDPFAPAAPAAANRRAGHARPPARPRRALAWALGVGLPLALVATMIGLLSTPTDATPLSVANPGPEGARALAQVLARHGVEVIAAGHAAAAAAQATGDTTLAIAGPAPLSERQMELYAQADCAVVLIDPDPELRERLSQAIDADRLTVIEDQAVVTNAGIVEGDNAARALKALGGHRRLVWSLARPEDDQAAGADLWQFLPPWARFAAIQLVIAAAAAALWRGRRMGRLVAEELPVAVPASEITTGLGRLYRRSQAFGHAAAALRAGAAARIGPVLGLGPASAPATLVAGAARAAGRAEPAVEKLFYGPAPRSARELTELAAALEQLEREVFAG